MLAALALPLLDERLGKRFGELLDRAPAGATGCDDDLGVISENTSLTAGISGSKFGPPPSTTAQLPGASAVSAGRRNVLVEVKDVVGVEPAFEGDEPGPGLGPVGLADALVAFVDVEVVDVAAPG